MVRTIVFALLTGCLLFGAASSTRAEQITLTSGFISGFASGIDNPYVVDFAGGGFSMQQHGEVYLCALNNVPLTPNQTVTASASFLISTSGGFLATVTYNGVTYVDVRPSGTLIVNPITLTIPSAATFNSTITSPFSLAGTLSFSDINGLPLFSVDVAGSGTATFRFDGVSGLPGTVALGTINYGFTPTAVPEPATTLMLGTGIATLAYKRRRHSRAFKEG